MIRSVEVAGFQSLRRAKIVLGRFTVITGPSNSGKSAFIRAIALLASNARGTDYITRGQKSCSVVMTGDEIELDGIGDEPWTVMVHRTAAGRGDQYRMQFTQMGQAETQTFTKMAGKVPPQVEGMLRISPLNFARQLDRPYLLDATGGDVARVLGELTNVTMVFRAAGEAEKRRRATLGELRTRKADLDRLVEQARQYENLPQQKSAVELAEESVERAAGMQVRAQRLDLLSTAHGLASTRLELVKVPPEPPSLEKLAGLAARLARLTALDEAGSNAAASLLSAEAGVRRAEIAETKARDELDEFMAQWGVCPTCGQRVRKN